MNPHIHCATLLEGDGEIPCGCPEGIDEGVRRDRDRVLFGLARERGFG